MSDTQAVEYRRLVSNLAASLSAEEVERVAYIRLTDHQSPDKYNAKEPGATGLNLLATLERVGVFSRQNVDGLVEIARDVGRRDLLNKVEEFKKHLCAVKPVKKKPRRRSNGHLELTFEMMVTKLAALEQHVSLLQRTLNGESDMQDESLELLRNTEKIVQDLALKLHQAQEKLSNRSLTNSGSSWSSGSVEATGCSTIPSPVDPNHSPSPQDESRKRKPVPIQRKNVPMQESAPSNGEVKQLLVSHACEDKRLSTYVQAITSKKQPMFPKKAVSKLSTGNTGTLARNYLPHKGQVNDGLEDNTGDSGVGTGSDTGPYCTVELWRQAMKNPPPDSSKHTYQSITSENREPDTLYKVLERK